MVGRCGNMTYISVALVLSAIDQIGREARSCELGIRHLITSRASHHPSLHSGDGQRTNCVSAQMIERDL